LVQSGSWFLHFDFKKKLQNKNSQKLTNDPSWAEFHADLLKKDFVKYLLSIKSNFGKDGLVEDDVLAKYGISCLNECSNNGKCYKSKTKFENIRVHTTIVAAFIVRYPLEFSKAEPAKFFETQKSKF
jgi:hypothetical protein